tara:strand:+ start:1347 stop:2531 length:1185 start_codon:yes stop_codon:yes gene_type:complete
MLLKLKKNTSSKPTQKLTGKSLAQILFATLFIIMSEVNLPKKHLFVSSIARADLQKESRSNSFVADAVNRSGAAVVTLEIQRRIIEQGRSNLPPSLRQDPYFRRFFGLQEFSAPRSRIERAQGSGVIFSSTGLVLTNAHVVENTKSLQVGMSDGRSVRGSVVGRDSLTDLAVIQLEGIGPWPTAPLGNSDDLVVGDWAIAVGNPFGLENTVTLGIISNLNRNVGQLGISGKRLDLIQTDAAINPGNSGGPLLNSKGEVIGINTLIRSGPGAGLGFAIPINRAREISKQLIEKGKATHPIIGVSLSKLKKKDIINQSNTRERVIIRYVIPGSPADIGGLITNDIIISINDREMYTPSDVISIINKSRIKEKLKFIIKRNNKKKLLFLSPIDASDL